MSFSKVSVFGISLIVLISFSCNHHDSFSLLNSPKVEKSVNHNGTYYTLDISQSMQEKLCLRYQKVYDFLSVCFPDDFSGDRMKPVFYDSRIREKVKRTYKNEIHKIYIGLDKDIENQILDEKNLLKIDMAILDEILLNKYDFVATIRNIYNSVNQKYFNDKKNASSVTNRGAFPMFQNYAAGLRYLIRRSYLTATMGLGINLTRNLRVQDLLTSEDARDQIDFFHEQNLNFLLENNNRSVEQLVVSFLHFQNMLSAYKIKLNKSQYDYFTFNPSLTQEVDKFRDLASYNFHSYIERLKADKDEYFRVTKESFVNGLKDFMYPYEPMVKHACDFWGVPKVYYETDVFHIYQTLAFYSPSNNSILIGETLNELTPNFIFSHELAHYIQYNFNFSDYIFNHRDAYKYNSMGLELEADFMSAYYLAHKDGMNLPEDKLEYIRNNIFQKFGDPSKDLDYLSDPHGVGFQRQYAFIYGCYCAYEGHKVDPIALHETFTKFYKASSLFRQKIDLSTVPFL